ncbi:hypothetical protein IAD21_01112 [Abditibacteriota bacterium]|nr:hypothetical protein IAD21_01112 [Abditibacteriota bacterium]
MVGADGTQRKRTRQFPRLKPGAIRAYGATGHLRDQHYYLQKECQTSKVSAVWTSANLP